MQPKIIYASLALAFAATVAADPALTVWFYGDDHCDGNDIIDTEYRSATDNYKDYLYNGVTAYSVHAGTDGSVHCNVTVNDLCNGPGDPKCENIEYATFPAWTDSMLIPLLFCFARSKG